MYILCKYMKFFCSILKCNILRQDDFSSKWEDKNSSLNIFIFISLNYGKIYFFIAFFFYMTGV
jgi:hypothetical protein